MRGWPSAAPPGIWLAPSQETRLESVITRLGDTVQVPGCLRELRALEVLERIGTAEAKAQVERLAAGDAAILATREAQVILKRWQ